MTGRHCLHPHPTPSTATHLLLLLLLLSLQHLPHEFKLLYHNETIDHPHLSNCNLPSLCAKCRTRDGLQRPVADLMASSRAGSAAAAPTCTTRRTSRSRRR